ncbi:beta-glucosidase [Paraoerskovia marina]|uniref:Beta-glucosidase n=1 Tax=Paraoerskovia marina TaxID=545619 RepID=A0A1H1VYD6_9CELL|nr:glycoside hydrolase family 3 C-terminal domain-containing protein [Paraoerskovia marina]SDS89266.1 beta-glucosidase [Paraoerskovia marina]
MSTRTRPETGLLARSVLGALTLEEKISLVVGRDMWTTRGLPRVGLRPIALSDGPVGVRGTSTDESVRSAMLPAPSALSATWDRELAWRVGALFASEARRHGVDVVLAPQVNLQRTPVGGRHFECYSEDPHLTAEIAVAVVSAAQERGVGMCVKHFVANDSETDRTRYVARVEARALREVYLPPFERLVREAGAWSVMGAYSGVDVGGVAAPALEHRPLLTGVLKDEWGFDGVVVSDWVATKSVLPAVRGGLDLQMPGPDGPWGVGLHDAVAAGEVTEAELDEKVSRILLLAERVGALAGADAAAAPAGTAWPDAVGERPCDAAPPPQSILREVTARSVVVLKDDPRLIPTGVRNARRIALVGPNAAELFLQGGGSSFVRPDHVTHLPSELQAALPATRVDVHPGARARQNPPALDVGARCTDPESGLPGVRIELLSADGHVLSSVVHDEWNGWFAEVVPEARTLRLTTSVHLAEPGRHALGAGTVGVHRVLVDGQLVCAGDVVVAEEIILSSGHNHPVATTVVIDVDEPTDVVLAAELQVVHPVGYDSFVRAALVHRLPGPGDDEVMAQAVEAARAADLAVVVVGTTEEVESEGFDRTSLDLPGNQDELVRRVVAANPRTVVVVNAGAPVLLPWLDDAPSVLWAWLPGQEGGAALADVLTGQTEPSGRLPWTLPARASDVPVPHATPVDGIVEYAEGVHVGYRAWERDGLTPAACFGHGLGWTTWSYDGVTLVVDPDHPGDVTVDVTIRNDGERSGREVVQVYVEPPPGSQDDRPRRWLGGFTVVDVDPGESATARVRVPLRVFQVWSVDTWVTPVGRHTLRVGRSVRDLRLTVGVPPLSPNNP